MNIKQLKELALSWSHSEVACMPIEEFADVTGTPLDDVRILFGAANALDSLIDRLEAAERERDDLRTELKASSANAMSWMKRALLAEKELERRDAAASEPAAYIIKGRYDKVNGRDRGQLSWHGLSRRNAEDIAYYKLSDTPLYTAAQPAVLPPEVSPSDMRDKWPAMNVIESHAAAMVWNQCRADALTLGAHQQKVVTHPETSSYVGTRQFIFERDAEWISALDAANVPYEVKK